MAKFNNLLIFRKIISKYKENQMRRKLNGTHQLPVYADDTNLLGDNIDNINKNTETLIDTSKVASLEVNTEKQAHVALSSLECRARS
jgi:hypothetical protein